ncbi:MAG: iron ABC transporter permease [Thermoplasmataceae archaeon]
MKGYKPIYWIMLLSPSIFVVAVVVYPYFYLVRDSFNSSLVLQVFGNSITAQLTREAIGNSFYQGITSALAALAIGLPLGLFLGSFEFRFKKLISSITIVPFFMPSIVVVFAFISGFNSNSIAAYFFPGLVDLSTGFTGIVAVNTFFNAPLVAMFAMTAVEQVDPALIQASETLGTGIFRRFYSIWGRSAITAALGGALLTFAYSFSGFAAPLIIGGPKFFTMDAWIYSFVKVQGDLSAAVVMAAIEALLLFLPAVLYMLFAIRHSGATGNRTIRTAERRKLLFFTGLAYTILWLSVEFYLFSSVILRSLSGTTNSVLVNYSTLFQGSIAARLGITTTSAILNSLFYGMCTALLVAALGTMWITGKRRLHSVPGNVTEIFQYIPLVISSILMAFSLYIVIGTSTPTTFMWVLIVMAQSSVAIPVVLRVIDAGFLTLPQSVSEASMTLKGNPFFDVELPLAGSAFASALVFGFGISLGEFSATNFLASSSYIPITVEIYGLENARLLGPAYAAASILMIVSVIAFYLIMKFGGRFAAVR